MLNVINMLIIFWLVILTECSRIKVAIMFLVLKAIFVTGLLLLISGCTAGRLSTVDQQELLKDGYFPHAQNHVIETAEQVFSQHGYRGASLQAIADQAKLPKANILYYMGSLKALYVRLLNRMLIRWNAVLEDITEDSDPGQVLSDFIRTKMMLGQRYPEGSKLFAAEIWA